jgi:hypothetical protein
MDASAGAGGKTYVKVSFRFFAVLVVCAVVFAIGNIGQYLYFTGRIRADAARYTEREREFESLYAGLERELDGERRRKREALEIVGGIEAAIDGTGSGVQAAIGLVRHIKSELKELEDSLGY